MAFHERHARGSQAEAGLPIKGNDARGSSKALELLKDNTGGSTRVLEVRACEPRSFDTNEVSEDGHSFTTARGSSSHSKTAKGHEESRSNAPGQVESEKAPHAGRPTVLRSKERSRGARQDQVASGARDKIEDTERGKNEEGDEIDEERSTRTIFGSMEHQR